MTDARYRLWIGRVKTWTAIFVRTMTSRGVRMAGPMVRVQVFDTTTIGKFRVGTSGEIVGKGLRTFRREDGDEDETLDADSTLEHGSIGDVGRLDENELLCT